MSTLSELISAADDSPAPSAARTSTPELPKNKGHSTAEDVPIDPVDEIILSERRENEILETNLGIAVDNFMTNWSQLLLLVNTVVGHTQPSLDHIKEEAECSAKNLKDACLELSGEFTRAALQWRLNRRDEAMTEDIEDFKAAILRQQTLISRTEGVISRHLGDFPNSNSQSNS